MSEATRTLIGNQYTVTHTVGYNQPGIRLDQFLMQRYRRRSRAKLKKVIDSGAVTIIRDQSPHLSLGKIKPSFTLQGGDIVKVISTKRAEPPVSFDYKILYEDEHIAVVDKPPNLPVHPAGKFFFNTLLVHLKTDGFRKDLASERVFFLVHRIDKETSGVLLLAKTSEACNALTSQFRNRETGKYYLAIVRGAPSEEKFMVDASIGKIKGSKIGLKMFAVPEEKGGLPSLTSFELVETRQGLAPHATEPSNYSLLACFPKTGRQHQIRVHAEIAGLPLVGDKIYGMPEQECLTLLDGLRDELSDMASEANPEPVDENIVSVAPLSLAEVSSDEDDAEEESLESTKENIRAQKKSTSSERFEIPGPTTSTYAELESRLLLPRHALHAAGLKFKHPVTGEEMVFESPLPADLRAFFEGLDQKPLQAFRTKHWA